MTPKPTRSGKSRGSVLIPAVLLLVVLMIVFPALVRLTREDVRSSVRRVHREEGLAVAEAGLDRGAWKLGESDVLWFQASTTTIPVPDYDFDREWTDLDPDYRYKIRFASGPGGGEVTVRCRVQSVKNPDFTRELAGVYTRDFSEALIMKKDFSGSSDNFPEVHWGAIKSFDDLNDPADKPMPRHPRKYSRKGIRRRDMVADAVNTDGNEYWAYDKKVVTPPVLDLDYYRSRAKRTSVPVAQATNGWVTMRDGATPALADPVGSGYFTCGSNNAGGNRGIKFVSAPAPGNMYEIRNSSTVIYIENDTAVTCDNYYGDANNHKVFLEIEALILTSAGGGDNHLNVKTDQTIANGLFYDIQSSIPVHAEMEYAVVPGTWTGTGWGAGDVFAPGGPNAASMSAVHGASGLFTVPRVGFRGLLHVDQGRVFLDINRDFGILGVVYVQRMKTDFNAGRQFRIWLDPIVQSKLKILYAPLRRKSYREVLGNLWNSP